MLSELKVKIFILGCIISIGIILLFALYLASASSTVREGGVLTRKVARELNVSQAPPLVKTPEAFKYDGKTIKTIQATITGYSSDVDQTDLDPFITASGSRVKLGIIANNCLQFGQTVSILGTYYEIQDRMNKRYGCEYFDIWFSSRAEAIRWGVQKLAITIYE